jgi:hypothetical protein
MSHNRRTLQDVEHRVLECQLTQRSERTGVRMVGVVAGVPTPSAVRSTVFSVKIDLAHRVIQSGEALTGASAVTMPEGPRTDGQ